MLLEIQHKLILIIEKSTNILTKGKIMKLPKIKMLYLRSAKTEPHTKEEMDFVANCQNDIEIYSIETCAKSIRKPNGMYYVELFGYSWSSEHYDEKNGSKWNDFRRLPFTNGNFDIEWAISEFGLSENYAIKYFGYKKQGVA
jgi:hypothetical protein